MHLVSRIDEIWPKASILIENKQTIYIKAYGVLPVTEEFLRKIIQEILISVRRQDLISTATMLLKELTVNAAKANFKRIIFSENDIDSDSTEQYERGMTIFKKEFSEEMPFVYGPKSKRDNLYILVTIQFNKDRLRIEVRNNTPMKKTEEERVRQKLALAMSSDDIGEFIMNHGDDSEGAGLGIFMSLAALKAAGVDPRVCVIKTDGNRETLASFELPLNPEYQPPLPEY